MIVTVSAWSGLTNAYRSVMSAVGSLAIMGASRWLDASVGSATEVTVSRPMAPAPTILRLRDMGSMTSLRSDGCHRAPAPGPGAWVPDATAYAAGGRLDERGRCGISRAPGASMRRCWIEARLTVRARDGMRHPCSEIACRARV